MSIKQYMSQEMQEPDSPSGKECKMSEARIKSFGGVVFDVVPSPNGDCAGCYFDTHPGCKGAIEMECGENDESSVTYQLADPHLHQQEKQTDPPETLRDRVAMRVLPELVRNGNPSTIVDTVADALAYADEYMKQRKEQK